MHIKIEDFFQPSSIHLFNVKDEEYKILAPYIESVDAFAKTTYQSIYVIDYNRRNFLYVSNNPLFLCGYTPEEVKALGYSFYLQQVPEKDLQFLLDVNMAGFNFYERIPQEEKLSYTISYDFYLKQPNNKTILINHKLKPFLLNDNQIWLAMCIVSLSSRTTTGNAEIRKSNTSDIYKYDLEFKKWKLAEKIALGEKEKQILCLSAQGYTMNEIADKIFLSMDTIKFYRKNLLAKLDVKNITEAITYATNHNIL